MDSKLVNKSSAPFVDPKCHTTVQNASKPFTNQQLIPIYTQFCNRYLLKQQLPTIHDLTYEIREPRKLVQLVHAVTFGCSGTSQSALFCSLNAGDPVDQIERCLQYLAGLGVNVSNCCAKDLHSGHLGEILALIFALSHYKQQQKSLSNLITASPQHVPRFVSDRIGHAQVAQLNSTTQVGGQRESKLAKMSATKLRRPLGSTSSLADTSSSTPIKSSIPSSKLLAPTRRVSSNANPAATSSSQEPVKLIQARVPSAPPASNRLKPPTTATKLQRPTPQSVNKSKITPPTPNVTSLASSTTSSTSSAASFSSTLATTSGATLTKSQLKPPKSLRPPSVTRKSDSKPELQVEKVAPKTSQKTEAPAR
ncbi:Neuron navigator 2 isoform X11 [Aphelenchoides bicaudatus]|nr:Neuron navigator 2 isoform X11 [Aphelenchoides bicaudatus]